MGKRIYIYKANFSNSLPSFLDLVVAKNEEAAESLALNIIQGIDTDGLGCDENCYVDIIGELASSPETALEDIKHAVKNEPKYQFSKSFALLRLNGHGVDLYEKIGSEKIALQHDRNGIKSQIRKTFENHDAYRAFVDHHCGDCQNDAQRLNLLMGALGVDGFPCSTPF